MAGVHDVDVSNVMPLTARSALIQWAAQERARVEPNPRPIKSLPRRIEPPPVVEPPKSRQQKLVKIDFDLLSEDLPVLYDSVVRMTGFVSGVQEIDVGSFPEHILVGLFKWASAQQAEAHQEVKPPQEVAQQPTPVREPTKPAEVLGTLPSGEMQLPLIISKTDLWKASISQIRDWQARKGGSKFWSFPGGTAAPAG